jgi:hypothetical protein
MGTWSKGAPVSAMPTNPAFSTRVFPLKARVVRTGMGNKRMQIFSRKISWKTKKPP